MKECKECADVALNSQKNEEFFRFEYHGMESKKPV